jgi:hypothetical protein
MSNTRILSVVLGSAALAALISATPVAAQGVPAGLLRLDSNQSSFGDGQLSEAQQAKLRSSYNQVRTKQHHVPAQ